MTRLPLDGVTILEFGHTVMGPACGLVMADLGADVIRVEPAPKGDPTRGLFGFATGFFSYFNRNKRCIAIDLKNPEGLATACALIDRADALIENYGPGTMDRLGLGWQAVHARNPRLIYCELKGFMPGPYEKRPAMDEVVQYMAGLAYMTGPPGTPMRAGASVVDVTGGLMGALGIFAALRLRDADGVGRRVTGTLFESTAFLVAQHMAQEAVSGTPAVPMPNRAKAWSVYELYPTADARQVFIAVISERQWRSLCAVVGLAEMAEDPRLGSNAQRIAHREEVQRRLAEATARIGFAALCGALEAADVPFSPVSTPSDLFDDPQMNVEGRMLPIRMGDGRTARLPPLPVAIDGQTMGLRLQPPAVGEHTEAVLAGLGYDAARIAALRACGAVR